MGSNLGMGTTCLIRQSLRRRWLESGKRADIKATKWLQAVLASLKMFLMFRSLRTVLWLLAGGACCAQAQNAPCVLKSPAAVSVARGGGTAQVDLRNVFGISNARGLIARFDTASGAIDVELFAEVTPLTVANFRAYVNGARYKDTFIHRAMPGFVIQGGGYKIAPDVPHIAAFASVKNEFQRSNLPGTIAMAKLGGDPNSATSEWFFNLVDNSANLDNQNGGFTVFGKILAKGLARAQAVAGLQIVNLGGALSDCPIINYKAGQQLTTDNLVAVRSVTEIPLLPVANATSSYLKLSAVSSNTSLLKATLSGSELKLVSTGNAVGEATVTMTAEDPDQQKATATLKVCVIHSLAPVVSISAPDAVASESTGDVATLRISRSGSTSAALTVSLAFSGVAVNGTDLKTVPSTVVIPVGKAYVDLVVTPIDDAKAEGRENLNVKIGNTLTQRPGESSEAELTVLDNDVPSLTLTSILANTTEGGVPAKIRLERTGSTASPLTVPLLSFSGASPTLLGFGNLTKATIPAGKSSAEISFPVANDSDLTGTQTLLVSIGATTSANIPEKPVEITINDNDVPTLTMEAVDAIASEPGADRARLRIRRTGATTVPLTVFLSFSGTAVSGPDYTAPMVVTIPAGADAVFWDLVVKDDSLKEGQETVSVGIGRSIYYNAPGSTLNITINDND